MTVIGIDPGYFGIASTQIDENLTLMQLIEEIPQKHGLVGLLHEKPFMGVNGSGKHNNFSLGTDDGKNLFNGYAGLGGGLLG